MSYEEFRKKYYLSEFELFDGEAFIKFNIVDMNTDKNTITVAVTNRGKISVIPYELMSDEEGKLYFEYGNFSKVINVEEFEQMEDIEDDEL